MINLEALIKELQVAFALHGDIPVLLSVSTLDDDREDMIVHGDALGVTTERDHDNEGMFVRITGDDLE